MLDWSTPTMNKAVEVPEERTSDDINVQGSAAWLAWRNKGIGGSDSAALLGWSPYKTALQLWSEKVGLTKPEFGPFQMRAMERGKQLEPKIREWYEARVGTKFKEDVAEHPTLSFIRASYDGINFDFENPDGTKGRIVEIKAPNRIDHALAESGEIPYKYLTQLNWMGIVSGVKWFDYVSFGSDGTYHVVTAQADEVMQQELIKRATAMWHFINEKIEPPKEAFEKWAYPLRPVNLSTVEEPQVTEQEIESLVVQALKAQAEADLADAKFQALKEKLKQFLGDKEKVQCGEAVFGWQTRKGLVDYSAIPEIKSLDLEKFRKAETRAFYFKRSTK